MKEVLEGTLLKNVTKKELSHYMLLDLVGNAMEYLKVIMNHPYTVVLPVVFKVVLYVFT